MSYDKSASGNESGNLDDVMPVEELTAGVLRLIADRIAVAVSFADLIYRESEIDALWSLADIEARNAALANAADAGRRAQLRDQIGRAHDLIPDGRCTEAADVLRDAVPLLS